jgi:hypothetical protein
MPDPPPAVPELQKRPGVCYAVTDDGIELPVVDVTHPAFAFDASEPALKAVVADSLRSVQEFRTMSPADMLKLAEHSILLRSGMKAKGGVLGGLATYLNKLGPANLGRGYASDWDRWAATLILPLSLRHRLATTARLLADALLPALAVAGGPLHLVNIGGGTAIDSLNALIVVRKARGALEGRRVVLHVLDPDTAAPAFGARALAALGTAGGPLEGLDVTFEHVAYDWADQAGLAAALEQAGREDAVLAASSEGALFEYGLDDQIVANLRVTAGHVPAGTVFVGSVFKDVATLPEPLRWVGQAGGVAIRLLGIAALSRLATEAGWTVDRVEDGPISHVVALRRA